MTESCLWVHKDQLGLKQALNSNRPVKVAPRPGNKGTGDVGDGVSRTLVPWWVVQATARPRSSYCPFGERGLERRESQG